MLRTQGALNLLTCRVHRWVRVSEIFGSAPALPAARLDRVSNGLLYFYLHRVATHTCHASGGTVLEQARAFKPSKRSSLLEAAGVLQLGVSSGHAPVGWACHSNSTCRHQTPRGMHGWQRTPSMVAVPSCLNKCGRPISLLSSPHWHPKHWCQSVGAMDVSQLCRPQIIITTRRHSAPVQ